MVEPEPDDGEEVERPVVLAPRLAFLIPRAIDALPAGLSGRAVTTERVPPMPGERDLFGAFGTGDLADERFVDAADDDPGARLNRERRPLLRAGTGAGAPAGGGVLANR